jgi:hypothetical protein
MSSLQLTLRALTPFNNVLSEADKLERELGLDEAVQTIRERIAQTNRIARRRLYRLHDELARR